MEKDSSIQKLLQDRYFLSNEKSWNDIAKRVSTIYPKVYDLIKEMKFIPSSPTLMNAATDGERKGTLSSCFPMKLIDDSIDGIFDSLKEAAKVTKMGGGIGYDFSKLRSSKELVKSINRPSSGPLPFINQFNEMLNGIVQGGVRRGAGAGQLDIHHPNILDFIYAKGDYRKKTFSRFNFSIRIPDKFYKDLEIAPDKVHRVLSRTDNETYELTTFDGSKVTTKDLWDKIVYYAWMAAEPGLFNESIAYNQCTVTNLDKEVLMNPCCLTGDMKIYTDTGYKAIKEIVSLDKNELKKVEVLSYNIKKHRFETKVPKKAWLAKKQVLIYNIHLRDGATIKCTGDHKFLTASNEWIEARNLKRMWCLQSYAPEYDYETCHYDLIQRVDIQEKLEDVYDITIPDNHNFIVNGIVAHNSEFVNIPYSSCNLGSLNLTKFIKYNKFDWDSYKEAVGTTTIFLDKVIDVNEFPLKKIEEITKKIRPIGLGVMGLAHLFYELGISYASMEAKDLTKKIINNTTLWSMKTSIELAKKYGSYPIYDFKLFLKANKRFNLENMELFNNLQKYGVRNSCFTSIAPTGSISFLSNVSSGIEPVFALSYIRKIEKVNNQYEEVFITDPVFNKYLDINYKKTKKKILEDIIKNNGSCQKCNILSQKEKDIFVIASDLTPMDHLDILEIVAMNTSLSVSKCVAKGTLIQTNKGIIPIEYLGGAKGEDNFGEPIKGLQVKDIDGNWQKVLSHYSGGRKLVKKITFNNGNILICSINHKLFTDDGWVKAKDLKEGVYIYNRSSDFTEFRKGGLFINNNYVSRNNANFINLPNKMSEDLALFLGMIVSDGFTVESSGCVGITTNNNIVEEKFKYLSKKIFNVDIKKSEDKRTKNTRNIYIISRKLVRYIENLVGKGCLNKNIPEQIIIGSKKEQINFINGVTLDGYIARNTLVLYDGYSHKLVTQLFSICCNLGLKPYLGKKYVPTGKLSKYSYFISINETYFKPIEKHKNVNIKGYNIIPVPFELRDIQRCCKKFKDKKRKNVYKSLKSNKFKSIRTNNSLLKNIDYDRGLYYTKIIKIEETIDEVYDVEIENTHSYLINNVISHNTINLSKEATKEDVSEVYLEAHKRGIIGVTVYRDGSREGILITKENGKIQKTRSPKRPVKLDAEVHHFIIKKQKYYVVVGLWADEPYEIFTGQNYTSDGEVYIPTMVKEGVITKEGRGKYILINGDDTPYSLTNGHTDDSADALTRMISTALRHGTGIEFIVQQLLKVKAGDLNCFSKALARALKKYIKDGTEVSGDNCPTCKGKLVFSEGCKKCISCGFSACN